MISTEICQIKSGDIAMRNPSNQKETIAIFLNFSKHYTFNIFVCHRDSYNWFWRVKRNATPFFVNQTQSKGTEDSCCHYLKMVTK